MKIIRGRLDKGEALKIPDRERDVFLTIAHIQNEISILLRLVLWSSDFSSSNEAVTQGQISVNLFLVKLLAGKLYEGWVFLTKHFFTCKSLAKNFNEIATSAQKTHLDVLKQYFKKDNLVSKVRNNYAFHYSPTELGSTLKNIPDELDLYVEEEGNFNTLYYFAEILANSAVLNLINPTDKVDALEKLENEVITIAKSFVKFGQSYMSCVIKRYSPKIWKESAKLVEFEKLPNFFDIQLPWFTDTSNEKRTVKKLKRQNNLISVGHRKGN